MRSSRICGRPMRKEGAIRSVICTGDNELTGIAIGKQCGIVTRTCLVARIDQDGRLVFSDPDKEDHPAAEIINGVNGLFRDGYGVKSVSSL